MKYGIFSDIHANLEAFEVVLDALNRENVDGYIFVGDIVGYGADPKKCLRLLKDLKQQNHCIYVAGNHDYAVCGETLMDTLVWYAREAVDYTKRQLEKEDLEFLKEMQLVECVRLSKTPLFTVVHANVVNPLEWRYIFDVEDAYPNFGKFKSQLCFVGHSHKPVTFMFDEVVSWSKSQKISIREQTQYIINVGSVGQPRDRDARACFAVYDTKERVVIIKRIPYDIQKAQKKILKAGLPKILAERLTYGK